MKILFFISSLSCGGAERATVNLANYWAGQGWRVTVVTLAANSEVFYKLNPEVKHIALNLFEASSQPLAALINNLRRVLALRRVLRLVQPDVAVSMMSVSNILLALAAYGLRCLVTIGSERVHPPQFPLSAIWETLRSFFYGRLDVVVALTAESATWLNRYTRAAKVVIIPNIATYPLSVQSPRVTPPVKAGNDRLLLSVGRLTPQKNFGRLITTFQGLAAVFPNWRLAILGEGPLRSELAAQIKIAGLVKRILLPGRVGNIGDWYEAADLYVMTSSYEGFPNALVEAMAYGLPGVSFDCDTGPRDIIRQEVDGLLVPNGNVVALEEALARMMSNETLRQQFAARSIEVRKRFSIEKITGMWETLFKKIYK